MLGSSIFAKASNMLLAILLVATFSIPISAMVAKPFYDPRLDILYTGPSMKTLKENLMPRFTRGAAGSESSGNHDPLCLGEEYLLNVLLRAGELANPLRDPISCH